MAWLLALPGHCPGLTSSPVRYVVLAFVVACHGNADPGLRELVQHTVADEHVAGLAVHVERNGRVLLHAGFGTTDAGSGAPITPDMVFPIGSVTKSFTAATVLRLAEQHKLALTDPISKYVPELHGDPTTIEQLLHQTAGFVDFARRGNLGKTNAQLVTTIAATPHAFAPGTRWEYSNTNYFLLGRAIEAASGGSYAHQITTQVIEPLGLTHTAFCTDAVVPRPTMDFLGHAKRGIWFDPRFYDAAGALCSNTADLAHYATSMFTGTLLKPASIEYLRTPTHGSTYGAGWVIDRVASHARIWHNGGVPGGYASHVSWYPDDKLTIVLLANTDDNATIDALDATLARAVLGLPQPPKPKRGSSDDPWR